MWSDQDLLIDVRLGFGSPEPWLSRRDDDDLIAEVRAGGVAWNSPWVTVHTYAKSPVRGDGGRGVVVRPSGYEDGLFAALIFVTGMNEPTVTRAGAELTGLLFGEAQCDNPRDLTQRIHRPPRLGSRWRSTTATVAGQTHPADTLTIADRWTLLVDLPDVAVATWGPEHMRDIASQLIDVRNSLRGYN